MVDTLSARPSYLLIFGHGSCCLCGCGVVYLRDYSLWVSHRRSDDHIFYLCRTVGLCGLRWHAWKSQLEIVNKNKMLNFTSINCVLSFPLLGTKLKLLPLFWNEILGLSLIPPQILGHIPSWEASWASLSALSAKSLILSSIFSNFSLKKENAALIYRSNTRI